jgi:phosphatidylglycerophosphate synthase
MQTNFKKNIPNILSLSRIFLFIPLIILYDSDYFLLCLIVVSLYSFISDELDGYYAKKWNVCSEFGAILDSLGDKIFVISSLFILLYKIPSVILLTLSIMTLIREMVRISFKHNTIKNLINVDKISIIKTYLQYFSLPLLYYNLNLGLITLSISVLLGLKFYVDLYKN